MPKTPRGVPWIETRHGVYQIRWYEPPTPEAKQRDPQARGQAYRLGLRTRDAHEAAARLAAFIQEGHHKIWTTGQLTVELALQQYNDGHVEKKVVAQRRSAVIIRHLTEFFGNTPLPSIDIAACEAYAEARSSGDRPVAPATIRRELVVLRAAAAYAFKRNRIPAMPKFEIPSSPEPDHSEDAWLTKDEIALLVQTAKSRGDQRIHDFIVLAYGWGARRADVETLEVSQVLFDRNEVNLRKPGQLQTKKRKGRVRIYPEQREVLERLVRESTDGFLFGRRYESYRPFVALCRECGLEGSPHILRHSRASHMIMDGESINKVAALLHDSIKTVERVYKHHSTEWFAEEAR